MNRCCAKCRTPYSICAHKSCKCHNGTDAEIILFTPRGSSDG